MIRHFDLRDSLFVQRLAGRGVCLDGRVQFTTDLHLLRDAVFASFFPSLLPETQMIDYEGKPFGFAQISNRQGRPASRLLFYSPKEISTFEPGSGLVEALLKESGRRHAQHLLAEAEENTEQYGFLRREGFAVYARQDIWKGTVIPVLPGSLPEGMLRPLKSADEPSVLALYSSVVPVLVQQVEGLPRPPCGWGLLEEGEMVGVFLEQTGSRGIWIEPFFHPGARHVAEWTVALMNSLSIHSARPLYVCVRSYQDWLGFILRDFGFSLCGEQAVMARRVVVPVPAAQKVPLPAVETGLPNVTSIQSTPVCKIYDTPTSNHR
jgi:hypothetical protein